jgi:hypothetical protein
MRAKQTIILAIVGAVVMPIFAILKLQIFSIDRATEYASQLLISIPVGAVLFGLIGYKFSLRKK